MTGYGPPPGPPAPPPPPPRPPMHPERRAQVLGYTAGGLGVLSFVWGFLDWFNLSTAGYSVYGGGATAAIGLSIVAGLLAAARAWQNKPLGDEPAVIAIAGLLVTLGVLIGKSSTDAFGQGASVGTKVGQILQLITAIAQAGVLVFAWLVATGRLPAPRPHQPGPPPQQWQQAGPPRGYQGPPPGYQQPPPPPPQQYQQPQPPGYQGPPPGYQPPPGRQ